MTPSPPVRADRAVGAVLAAAAGDALGAPYEFDPPNPDAPCQLEGGGHLRWPPGEWTDDTQMALAVLTPLSEGVTTTGAIAAGFATWFASGPPDVGNQTRSVLARAARGVPMAVAASEFQTAQPEAAGDGALMRTGPVALAHLGDREAVAGLAAEVAALTHPHPDSVDACVLWSLAIEHTITNADGDTAFDWISAVTAGLDHLDPARRGVWRDRIAEAAGADPEQWCQSNGWVVAAFQAALAAITVTPLPDELPCTHLQDALVRAARAGGDTDTVAAIAGALLGARWGSTAVPIGWRSRLVGRRAYDELPLPAVQLDAMARLAVTGGRPDSVEWPGVDRLLPYYLANFDSVPRLHEIEGAWFGNVAALPDALDRGATVVVSLCRMGTQDVPPAVAHDVVGLLDTTAADNPNLTFVLADTAAHVANLVDSGQRVFVHCVAAENRTPAVAAAFLHARGATPAAALATVATSFGREPQSFLSDGVRALGA